MSSFRDFYAVRVLFTLVVSFILLSGCSSTGESEEDAYLIETSNPEPVKAGVWQVESDPRTVAELLRHGKGLLLPVLKVTDQNLLIPDYRTTLTLYEHLQNQAGMDLMGAGNTMKFYYQLVSAVEHRCPKDAVDPLLSCSLTAWLPQWFNGWMNGEGVYDDAMMQAWFDALEDVNYLIVPDRALLSSPALKNLKYSPDSEPIVDRDALSRWQDIVDNLDPVSLSLVVRYQRHCHEDWCWLSDGLANCRVPVADAQTREQQLDARNQAWQSLLTSCATVAPVAAIQ